MLCVCERERDYFSTADGCGHSIGITVGKLPAVRDNCIAGLHLMIHWRGNTEIYTVCRPCAAFCIMGHLEDHILRTHSS